MRVEAEGRFCVHAPDGRVIETQGGERGPGGVERENAELGLKVDVVTAVAQWRDERCDYGSRSGTCSARTIQSYSAKRASPEGRFRRPRP